MTATERPGCAVSSRNLQLEATIALMAIPEQTDKEEKRGKLSGAVEKLWRWCCDEFSGQRWRGWRFCKRSMAPQ
jgi:hypothetical protein